MGKKEKTRISKTGIMGEIKSTLDLVLERTRELTLSDAEKRQLKQEEFRKRLRGLIVRFQKGQESIPSTAAELEKAGVEFGLEPRSEFFCQLLKEINLHADNAPLLSLARQVCLQDTRGIETILTGYADEAAAARNRRTGMIRKEFAKTHGISGEAVVPNLEADRTWEETLQQIRKRHLRRIEDVSEKAGCRLESIDSSA